MEKNLTNRYCFASTDRTSLFSPADDRVNVTVQVYQYDSCKLFILESKEELLEVEGVKIENRTQYQTERIFMKMPIGTDMAAHHQAHAYEGTKRIVMTLELQPDPELLEEYRKVHRPENMWQQVISNMDTVGVKDMELYLYGYRAFLLMDVPLDFEMSKVGDRWGKLPREQEWQNYVSRFQKTDPESKIEEKWEMMNPIQL